MPHDKRKQLVTTLAAGGPTDTTAPTCTITSTASGATAAAFTCTFTFSEAVTGFVLGDITVSANASAGTFNTVSTSVYTAVITPTATGTVTVDVNAGVCTDAAGNANTAATQFSIVYISAVYWFDFSDATTMFTDTGRTAAVTADGDLIAGMADKSGSANHLTQSTSGLRPKYKLNIKNGRSAGLFETDVLVKSGAPAVTQPCTLFAVCRFVKDANSKALISGTSGSWTLYLTSQKPAAFAGSNLPIGGTYTEGYYVYTAQYNGASSLIRISGTETTGAAGAGAPTGIVLGAYQTTGTYDFTDYVCEVFLCSGALTGAQITAVEGYLAAKWINP